MFNHSKLFMIGFRNFMELICNKWKPSTRRILDPLFKKSKIQVMSFIKDSLNQAQYVSLTIDVWSDRRLRSFLGVTAHFVDEKFEFHFIM